MSNQLSPVWCTFSRGSKRHAKCRSICKSPLGLLCHQKSPMSIWGYIAVLKWSLQNRVHMHDSTKLHCACSMHGNVKRTWGVLMLEICDLLTLTNWHVFYNKKNSRSRRNIQRATDTFTVSLYFDVQDTMICTRKIVDIKP